MSRTIHIRVGEDLYDRVEEHVEEDPRYGDKSKFVRAGIRMLLRADEFEDAA